MNAQFSYSTLTCLFHSRKLNNEINKLRERCLEIVYNNNASTYEELLETEDSVLVHFRNAQALVIELYKVVNEFSTDIMKDVFLLITEKLGNMCIAIVCKPVCDVMNFEVNLVFLIRPFFLHEQNVLAKT